MYPQWLNWVQRLQALAQTGLHYTQDPFERERYQAVADIAAEIAAGHSDTDADHLRAKFAAQNGHATPKVDGRGVVFHDGKILLVREVNDGGRWTVPGGWVDPGEPPSVAAVREVQEESGFQTRAVKLLAVYDRNLRNYPPHVFHIYKLFFLCEITGGEATTSLETSEVRFFPPEDIPQLDLSTGRVTAAQIARFFEHYQNPDIPTDFD